MLFKILIFIVVLFIIYIIFFKNRVKSDKNSSNKNIENFVQCTKCDTFIEIKSAIISNGKYLCKECLEEKK
ncbi:MAG: PP0621 family protein [Campylobacter sp.]